MSNRHNVPSISSFFTLFGRPWQNMAINELSMYILGRWQPRHFKLLGIYGLKHGLRMPNEAFFHWNPELLGLGRQIGQTNFGSFWVFSAKLSAPLLVQWVPCLCFSLLNHYFYKKLSLYIHIPNISLGLGFEFRPQRISDLAFVCQ